LKLTAWKRSAELIYLVGLDTGASTGDVLLTVIGIFVPGGWNVNPDRDLVALAATMFITHVNFVTPACTSP
jgi:hypothetical protein